MLEKNKYWILLYLLISSIINIYGCTIDGVNWNIPILRFDIKDIDSGEFHRVHTSNVVGITSSTHTGDELVKGPYIVANLDGDDLVLSLHENFYNYERHETVISMGFNIAFSCIGNPTTRTLTLAVNVQDTNNNEPIFMPKSEISFSVIPPLAPGFKVTGCNDHIVVEDIDLTTTAIKFGIEDNEYFEIEFDVDATVPQSKTFLGVIRTKTFIRSIPNPIQLTISATDVDETGDPPHTTYGTLTIERNPHFQLPDDLIFTETFYLATYSADGSIELDNKISLQQGFDENVEFKLSGELSEHFALDGTGNGRTLRVVTSLPSQVVRDNSRVLLVVTAERDLVPSTSSTIVIDLPREEITVLRFEQTNYRGSINKNNIDLEDIKLSEGFSENVNFDISGEYANYFNLITSNAPTLTLEVTSSLPEYVERLIILQLESYGPNAVTAYSTIILETEAETLLMFSEVYYTGSYTQQDGLNFPDAITLEEGYNGDVAFELEGTHSEWFVATPEGNRVDLSVRPSGIPESVLENNKHLTLTIRAERPNAITARATIVIALPDEKSAPEILRFEQTYYRGTIVDNTIILNHIVLTEGFSEDIRFDINGEYVTYFELNTNDAPTLTLEIVRPLPENDDRVIILQLSSYGPNAVTAYATIILETQLDTELSLLVFSEVYYSGSYNEQDGLTFTDIITLREGYNEDVTFNLEGTHSQWFVATPEGNRVDLSVIPSGIPEPVLENNQHLTLTIRAERPNAITGRATIVIALPDENSAPVILRFEQTNYRGTIVDNTIILNPIDLIEGFSEDVRFGISGEYVTYFELNTNHAPTLTLEIIRPLPENADRLIILQLSSYGPNAVTAYATIILETQLDTELSLLVFSEVYYSGSYNEQDGLTFTDIITLREGYTEDVTFHLEGTHSQWFVATPEENKVDLSVIPTGIPQSVFENNQHLTLTIKAESPNAITGRATIVIALPAENSASEILRFEQTNYRGTIVDNTIILNPIDLIEGFSEDIRFGISGEYVTYFELNTNHAPTLTLEIIRPLPENADRLIILQLSSYGPNAVTAYATIILETQLDTELSLLVFSEVYYSGSYNEQDGLTFTDIITLREGYTEEVAFELEGTHSQWFVGTPEGNQVDLAVRPSGIPMSVLANNQHLTLTIRAERPNARTGRSTIVIALPDEFTDPKILRFEHTNYRGSVVDNIILLDPINLLEGFTQDIQFDISGDYETFFNLDTSTAPTLLLELSSSLPESVDRLIILQLRSYGTNAVTAYATIVLETQTETNLSVLVFSEVYYAGSYNQQDGLTFTNIIKLSEGYDDNVQFDLENTHSQWFNIIRDGNCVELVVVSSGIPVAVLQENPVLTFSIRADHPTSTTGRSAIVIAVTEGPSADVYFLRALYFGSIELNVFQHEIIELVGYNGDIQIIGEWSQLFKSSLRDNEVQIEIADGSTLPPELNHVVLELRADVARTVLSVQIFHIDETVPPSVEFDPRTFRFRVHVTQTGFIGRVNAASNNGERIIYSLQVDNDHLNTRLSISADSGELHLSAPVNSGQYSFLVVATTAASEVSETASAQLIVDAVTVCGDEYVIPPLIVLERDEEEPHENIFVLEQDVANHCHLSILNSWPSDKNWLKVDDKGLHSEAIDREDESIAFMTVSQVRAELFLDCDNDKSERRKRSIVFNETHRTSRNDYSSTNWILAESILYNSRRSFVNLIVNDINDNYPIFNGKENEPIVMGYPVENLLDIINPRSLAELQATDKDIGINAKLVYWSDNQALTVDGDTGLVHVRNNMRHLITDQSEYIIKVRDRPGLDSWKTGNITLQVTLLETKNIAVLTIRDAFLSDEPKILQDLSEQLQYDVKSLRSTVISENFQINNDNELDDVKTRSKRDTFENIEGDNNGGASLLLYVYGLDNYNTPVFADKIVNDINEIGMNTIINNMVLEEYIDGRCPALGRNTALFAATISLSVLLFVLIIFIILWYFFKIRKINKAYEQFSDVNSITNQSNIFEEPQKVEVIGRPKINIEELKKSERRLQEMLNAPVEDNDRPLNAHNSQFVPTEPIIDIVPDKNSTIVIQSIDKLKDANDHSEEEDEFGEIKSDSKRKKSMVTFNENVEKIIHVENLMDDTDSVPDFEVDKL